MRLLGLLAGTCMCVCVRERDPGWCINMCACRCQGGSDMVYI